MTIETRHVTALVPAPNLSGLGNPRNQKAKIKGTVDFISNKPKRIAGVKPPSVYITTHTGQQIPVFISELQ